jgi:hypothetical protein
VSTVKRDLLHDGSESLRIIDEDGGVRFAIVVPGWSRSSRFPEVRNSMEFFPGNCGESRSGCYFQRDSIFKLHNKVQPREAPRNLSISAFKAMNARVL